MTAPTLRLDHNERLRGHPELADVLTDLSPVALTRYPDAGPLERRIADRWRIAPERVLATAGADDGIDRICRVCLRDRPELLGVDPTFEMIPRFARLAGGVYRAVRDPDDPAPDALLEHVSARTGLVAVVTPHNPTGRTVPVARLRALADRLPDPAALMVDLAYVEFADEDPTAELLERPDVLLVRTLSKAWGLAGARVGYVLGTPDRIAALRAGGPPFAIAAPSLRVAERALALGDRITASYVARVRRERTVLEAMLEAAGLEPIRSQANFVLSRTTEAERIATALARSGIRVRTFPDTRDSLRITLPGDPVAFERLLNALDGVLPNPDASAPAELAR